MKPFSEMTTIGQARRLHKAALESLSRYDIDPISMNVLSRTQGAVYRVDAGHAGKFVLRVSLPDDEEFSSRKLQLEWLQAIARDTTVAVPHPVVLPDGSTSATVAMNEGLEHYRCVLLYWVDGKNRPAEEVTVEECRSVGKTMALLHNHSQGYRLNSFEGVRKWNAQELFGAGSCLENVGARAFLSDKAMDTLKTASELIRLNFDSRSHSPQQWGVIHADLGLHNFVFQESHVHPIDFDEWGYGAYLYDLAAPLRSMLPLSEYRLMRHACLDAYAKFSTLPDLDESRLDLYVAAQCFGYLNWLFDYVPESPEYALPEIEKITRLCQMA